MATRLRDLDVDLITRGHLERGLDQLSDEYEDWDVADPAGTDLEGVRRIRDDISDRVRRLLAELTAPVAAAR